MKLLACLLAATALTQGGQVLFEDPTGTLRVTNMKEGEGSSAKGVFKFDAIGSPLIVEKLELGLKIAAPKMHGELATSGDPSMSFIRELHSEGGTTVTLDSKAAEDASIALAERSGKPVPKRGESQRLTEFKTSRLDYSGDSRQGVFTIPSSFTIESKSQGVMHVREGNKVTDRQFTQTMGATGVSAIFNLNPNEKVDVPLRSGTISGPLTVDLVRTESTVGTNVTETSKFSGSADKLVIDLEKERTLTLIGSVKVRGENSALIGTSEGDTVIAYLDESLNVIRIKILGKPSQSTAREKRGGGVKK